jgi:hypothetical protein
MSSNADATADTTPTPFHQSGLKRRAAPDRMNPATVTTMSTIPIPILLMA